jgi:hypothetical protein
MKTNSFHRPAVILSLFGLSVFSAKAITFSLDVISPTSGGLGAFLFSPGPVVVVPGGPPGMEVDAISFAKTGPIAPGFYFSVNRGSVGAPATAVAGESAFGDQAADIFVSTGAGFNFQFRDGNGIVANPLTPGAPSPPLGLAEPGPAPGDNLDALDLSVVGPMIYWSVNPATTGSAPYLGFSAADIFLAPTFGGYAGAPALYAPAGLLGLLAGDDIDALVFYDDGLAGATPGDILLFSLAPGSPSLGIGGASAADILITSPGAVPGLFLPAGAIGLLPTDDLDALDVIPEPGSCLMLGMALFGFAAHRRRR